MSINNKQWLGLPLNLLWGYIAIAVFMTGDGFELAFLSHYIKELGFSPAQASFVYASEADVLNMALFGHTAAQWRAANPGKDGNVRDYATAAQLVCLSNLENLNALFIRDGLPQGERLVRLNAIAIHQMTLLSDDPGIKHLEERSGKPRATR